MQPGKCSFFTPKVKYVGHTVSEIETDKEKIEKVMNWPTPTTPEDVRRSIGFAGYYRRLISNFCQIEDIMPSPKPTTGKQKKREQNTWTWEEKEKAAFKKFKQRFGSAPILGYPDYSQPFELHTDASSLG